MSATICVFCGAKPGKSPAWLTVAHAIGLGLAAQRQTLLYGGGGVGLMGAVAEGALAGKGQVIGIIPRALLSQEAGKFQVTRLDIVDSLAERKTRMIDDSDAFLILPGGLGTLDELFEVLTLRQIGLHSKPVVILDMDGYFASLRQLLADFVAAGFVREADVAHIRWAGTVKAALGALADLPLDKP